MTVGMQGQNSNAAPLESKYRALRLYEPVGWRWVVQYFHNGNIHAGVAALYLVQGMDVCYQSSLLLFYVSWWRWVDVLYTELSEVIVS
jgi:hypothetical protein